MMLKLTVSHPFPEPPPYNTHSAVLLLYFKLVLIHKKVCNHKYFKWVVCLHTGWAKVGLQLFGNNIIINK